MDQFCALQNEQYRRCTCSARLMEMRERERNFATATGMLKDFEDNNLNVVSKSSSEVKAMYKATEGESAIKKDNSTSVNTLSGISDVLATKNMDSASSMRNMTDIWGTTELVGGTDLSNLESTALYNAVHRQCAEMTSDSCDGAATFNMIVAAYGMYIEQDCTAYMDALDKKQKEMTTAARQAQGALAAARLENYDIHNSDEINACLTNVRNDMFGEAGCGPDNRKCIDYTGRFVNVTTGEPIYTSDFYMLGNSISLVGDTLRSSTNAPYINMLNGKKSVAVASLDKCRDIADEVWDEFLRQTLVDLSQRQFTKIREVQDNCISVVSECYDEKLGQIKQFASDVSEENIAAQQIGLTEGMCRQNLDTCAILYGGGPPGLQKLLDYVRNAQTVKLEDNCEKYVSDYVKEICTPLNDNKHGFPYSCRFYNPGEFSGNYQEINDTLYSRLNAKAREVCIRQDTTLTNEVKMVLNKIMDDVKLKMDGLLSAECESFEGGVWYTNTLGNLGGELVSIEEFKNRVGSDDGWGVCNYTCPANSVIAQGTKDLDNKLGGFVSDRCQCKAAYYTAKGTCSPCPLDSTRVKLPSDHNFQDGGKGIIGFIKNPHYGDNSKENLWTKDNEYMNSLEDYCKCNWPGPITGHSIEPSIKMCPSVENKTVVCQENAEFSIYSNNVSPQ
ncbi:MAG: hypothetical protein LBD94_02065, partial [Rickettsiales bacterium]|nr:hypothetical protein [Rickettsiales bacterium]